MDYEVQSADRLRETTKDRQKADVEVELQNRAYRQFQVENGSKLLNLSDFYLQSKRNLLDTDIQSLEYSKNLIDIETQANKLFDDRKLRIGELNLDTDEGRQSEVLISQEYFRQNSLLQTRKELLDNENNIINKKLELTQKINTEQEDLNLLLKSTDNLADSLAKSFGDIGTALGDTVKSLLDSTLAAKRSAETRNQLQEKQNQLFLDGLEDQAEYKSITIELSKLKDKDARRELTNQASIASSAKKFFNEKSKGYKVIEGIEKALHLKRLFMDVKEFLTKMGFISQVTLTTIASEQAITVSSIANSMKNAIGKIPSVLMTFYEYLGPFGAAAGAAAVALALSGGSSTSGVAAPTAEQKQEVTGSAMGYDEQGVLVQTNAGVFGDTKAKSESIVNSLEIIKDNSVIGLSYDNKILRALENVAQALTGAAKNLYNIPGLVSGSISGIQAGTNTGGGFLGIGGLFSTSVTKNIVDSGLKLSGTFGDIAKGANGTLKLFEDIQTIKSSSGFFGIGGSTKTTNERVLTGLETLDPKAQQAITDAFRYGQDLLVGLGNLAGIAESTITEQLATMPVDQIVSLRGLTGEDFNKALSNVLGNIFDQASESVFATFKTFANFGEGMLETVIRVTDTNIKIKQLLSNMGMGTDSVSFIVSEALADAAGGLTNFLDQSKAFSDNFLTEAERLVPVQKAVTTEMTRLGYAGVTTRKGFKELVQSLDITTKTGQDTYKSLMAVQEGFIQVTEAAGDATAALEDNLRTIYENRKKELQDLISGYGQVSKTLTDLKTSLLMGAESTLSPSEKYALAKTAYEAAVLGTQSTDPKVQLAAMQQLSTTGKDFLAISRVLYASSARYVQDFNSVLSAIDTTIPIADLQAQTAQDQLTALESMVGLLIKVDKATSTSTNINQGIKDYLTNQFGAELYDVIIAGLGETKLQTQQGLAEVKDLLNSLTGSESQKVLEAYKNVYGRTGSEVDVAGLKYWVEQVQKTGKLDQKAFEYELSGPIITEFGQEIYNQVSAAYEAIGRTGLGVTADKIDVEGLKYWASVLKETGTLDLRAFAGGGDIGKQVIEAYESVYGVPASAIDIEGLNYWIKRSTEAGGVLPQSEFERPLVDRLITTYGQSVYDTITKAYGDIGRTGFGTAATQIDVGGAEWWMNKMKESGVFDQAGFTYGATPHARGGIASGWSLLGEEGPELVNFTNPGRVYSANDTAMMMGNQSNAMLIEEIRNLRIEVQELRKEQNSQTGAIINSNYNANLIASENIGEAMKESAQQTEWAARSAVALK